MDDTEITARFVLTLAETRMKREMTQRELAWELQVTPQTVSNWETGRATPSLAVVVRWARVLDMDVVLQKQVCSF